MESAIRVLKTVERDGEIAVTGLPYRKGQQIELVLRTRTTAAAKRPKATARRILKSPLVGLWADRKDIRGNIAFARRLRRSASRRTRS